MQPARFRRQPHLPAVTPQTRSGSYQFGPHWLTSGLEGFIALFITPVRQLPMTTVNPANFTLPQITVGRGQQLSKKKKGFDPPHFDNG